MRKLLEWEGWRKHEKCSRVRPLVNAGTKGQFHTLLAPSVCVCVSPLCEQFLCDKRGHMWQNRPGVSTCEVKMTMKAAWKPGGSRVQDGGRENRLSWEMKTWMKSSHKLRRVKAGSGCTFVQEATEAVLRTWEGSSGYWGLNVDSFHFLRYKSLFYFIFLEF